MKKINAIIITIGILTAGSVHAADYADGPGNLCIPLAPSSKLAAISDDITLSNLVVDMMNEAIQVSSDPDWVNNDRPAFVWASEAKIACGKAYGYLQSSYRDEQYLDKCECFYERMQAYQY